MFAATYCGRSGVNDISMLHTGAVMIISSLHFLVNFQAQVSTDID
jgi:hypothetical protein